MIFTDRGRGPDEEECRQPGRRETHATSGAEGCAGRTELEAVQASQRFRSIRGRDPPIHMRWCWTYAALVQAGGVLEEDRRCGVDGVERV